MFERLILGFNAYYGWLQRKYDKSLDSMPAAARAMVVWLRGIRRAELGALSVCGRGVFPAHRSRPVCDQRENAGRNAHRGDRPILARIEKDIEEVMPARRSRNDRLEHWYHAGPFRDLYQQLGHAYGVRSGEFEGRPQARQLRIHGTSAAKARATICRRWRLIFKRADWWIPW